MPILSKAADLNQLVQGGQRYGAFPVVTFTQISDKPTGSAYYVINCGKKMFCNKHPSPPMWRPQTSKYLDVYGGDYGSFTLVMLFWQKRQPKRQSMFLPWPPWAMRQEIETILSVLRSPSGQGKKNGECHLLLSPSLSR